MSETLTIHAIAPGDMLTMIGRDGVTSEPFLLAEAPTTDGPWSWLYRESDVPIVVDRGYALDASFILHFRPERFRRLTVG